MDCKDVKYREKYIRAQKAEIEERAKLDSLHRLRRARAAIIQCFRLYKKRKALLAYAELLAKEV